MSTPPIHSQKAVDAHPAPERERFSTGAEYAEACRVVSEARSEFDAVDPASPRTSAEQRRIIFVERYIANGGNAAQAAKDAGYSEHTAREQGYRLLTNVHIKAEIARRQEELANKYQLTTDSVIQALGHIVHTDPRNYFNPDGSLKRIVDLDAGSAAALASVEIEELREDGAFVGVTQKIKFWDKNSAIEKAMKHLGLFERDNKQKTDPLKELFMSIGGNIFGVKKSK